MSLVIDVTRSPRQTHVNRGQTIDIEIYRCHSRGFISYFLAEDVLRETLAMSILKEKKNGCPVRYDI